MNKSLMRFVSASLAVVIILTTAMTNVYAATPSEGGTFIVTPGNFPGNGTNPTPYGDHGGVRVTVTNMLQAGESGVAPIELGDNYSAAVNQFNDLGNILTTKVWRL